jgi:hypothetical protein
MLCSGWPVRMRWRRGPLWSVKESCAPSCARSRLTIYLDPSGQAPRSTRSVISATCSLGRSPAVLVERRHPGFLDQFEDRGANALGQIGADRVADPSLAAPVQQRVRGAGGVNTHQQLDRLDVLLRDLPKRCLAGSDLISRGARAGLPGA